MTSSPNSSLSSQENFNKYLSKSPRYALPNQPSSYDSSPNLKFFSPPSPSAGKLKKSLRVSADFFTCKTPYNMNSSPEQLSPNRRLFELIKSPRRTLPSLPESPKSLPRIINSPTLSPDRFTPHEHVIGLNDSKLKEIVENVLNLSEVKKCKTKDNVITDLSLLYKDIKKIEERIKGSTELYNIINTISYSLGVEVIGTIGEGKSGDYLFIIRNEHCDKFIIKVSTNTNLLVELEYTEQISKLYTNYSFNPIISVIKSGTFNTSNKKSIEYYYYVMEILDPQRYQLLDEFIIHQNKQRSTSDKVVIKNVFENIIQAVSIFKKAGYSHCDLHTQNIFVNKDTFKIKIIDFGLAKKGKCEQGRQLTSKIVETGKKVNVFTLLTHLELLKTKDIDSDLAMLTSILYIIIAKNGDETKTIITEMYRLAQSYYMNGNIEELNKFTELYTTILREL